MVALCVSAVLFFHSYYYSAVYISGGSMSPTLYGADEDALAYADNKGSGVTADFGIIDSHQSAIKHIKRFDIVSTYYASDYYNGAISYGSTKKIKRIIALPNETFKITNGLLYVLKDNQYEYIPYPFKTNPAIETEYTGKDVTETHLESDQYWVLGDNRSASHDSKTEGPVQSSYILGVLVAIEGRGELYVKGYFCKRCGKTYSYNSVYSNFCPDVSCQGQLAKTYDIKNKQYHLPKYF